MDAGSCVPACRVCALMHAQMHTCRKRNGSLGRVFDHLGAAFPQPGDDRGA